MPNAFFSLGMVPPLPLSMPKQNDSSANRATRFSQQLPQRVPGNSRRGVRSSIFGTPTESGQSVVFEEFSPLFTRWFEVHAWPDRDGLNVYFSDVSERRNTEFAQSVALDEARQAQAWLTFVADVSTRLHGAVTPAELYERLSRTIIAYTADWCTELVPSGDELIRVAAAHRYPTLDGLAKRLVGGYSHPFSGPSPGVVVDPVGSRCDCGTWPSRSSQTSTTVSPARPTARH